MHQRPPCAKTSADGDSVVLCFAASWASLSSHIERRAGPLTRELDTEFDTYFPTSQTYNGEAVFMSRTVIYTRVLKRNSTSPKTNKCKLNKYSSDCDSTSSEKSDTDESPVCCMTSTKRGRLSYDS